MSSENWQYNFRQLYRSYKRRAKTKKLQFELSKGQFFELTQQRCYLCGSPPQTKYDHYKKLGYLPFLYNGVDRLDNNIGYIEGNCKTCCGDCNKMKRDWDEKRFIDHIKKIVNYYGG